MKRPGQQKVFLDAVRALKFLNEHEVRLRGEGKLVGRVMGPVAMHCKVDDPIVAAILEKVCPANRLLGFVTENEADSISLRKEMKGNNQADIFTVQNTTLESAAISVAVMKEVFSDIRCQGYLSDFIRCPDLINMFLNNMQKIHSVPWARTTALLDNNVLRRGFELTKSNTSFRIFCDHGRGGGGGGGVVEYVGRKSRYASAGSPPNTNICNVTGKYIVQVGTDGKDRDTQGGDVEVQRQQLEGNIERVRELLRRGGGTCSGAWQRETTTTRPYWA